MNGVIGDALPVVANTRCVCVGVVMVMAFCFCNFICCGFLNMVVHSLKANRERMYL